MWLIEVSPYRQYMNLCKVSNLPLYGRKLTREHHTTTIKHTVRTGKLAGLKKQLPVDISSRSLQRLVRSSEVNKQFNC